MCFRVLLVVPLGFAAYFLSAGVAGTGVALTASILLRRASEWLAEIHLAQKELVGDSAFSVKFSVSQLFLLVLVCAVAICEARSLLFFMLVWALSPLVLSAGFIVRGLRGPHMQFAWREILPNFGSTSVIGVGSYLFRILILVLAGRNVSGELFTAFSAGGMISSVYERVMGPSMMFFHKAHRSQKMARLSRFIMIVTVACGVVFSGIYFCGWEVSLLSYKPAYFWGAMGLSVIGGVIMLYAQKIKIGLIQNSFVNDIFAPDLLVNIFLIIAVPVFFYGFGTESLIWMFLLSGVFNFIFYKSFEFSIMHLYGEKQFLCPQRIKYIKQATLLLLFAPVFFQVKGGIFHSPDIIYSYGGDIKFLPLPVSLPVCVAALCLLGSYGAKISKIFLFSFFSVLSFSLVMAEFSIAKFILLAQYILPAFALMLGEIFARDSETAVSPAPMFFYALCALVPVQLVVSWLDCSPRITPYLRVFSVYQQYQYVSVIFVLVFIAALFALSERKKIRLPLLVMSAVMGIYSVAAFSFTAVFLFLSGLVAFFAFSVFKKKDMRYTALVVVVGVTALAAYFCAYKDSRYFSLKYNHIDQTAQTPGGKYPSVGLRLEIWKYYASTIKESGISKMLFGQHQPPPRETYPSAHNYYLDLIYNFGLLGFLPFAGLIFYTFSSLYKNRNYILQSGLLTGLSFIVFAVILWDNSLKVSFRQPYSGIFSFFLWGYLLKRAALRN